jgi:hypothetical protein
MSGKERVSGEIARIVAGAAQRGVDSAFQSLAGLTTELRQGIVVQDTAGLAKAVVDAIQVALTEGFQKITVEQVAQDAPSVQNEIRVEVDTAKMALAISDLFALDLRPDMSPLASPLQALSESLDGVAAVGKTQEVVLQEQRLAMLELAKSNILLSQALANAASVVAEAVKAPVRVERDTQGRATMMVKE